MFSAGFTTGLLSFPLGPGADFHEFQTGFTPSGYLGISLVLVIELMTVIARRALHSGTGLT